METTDTPVNTGIEKSYACETYRYGLSSPASALAKKMVSAMGDIEAVTKSGKNEKQGYKYVKAADVANEVRSVLVKHGIAFFYSVESVEKWEVATNSGGRMFFCQLIVEVTFVDSDTGDSFAIQGIGWGSDTLDKAPYKAMTGALKYILRTAFLIPDEEDPENDHSNAPRTAAERPKVSQVPAKATDAPRPGQQKPADAAASQAPTPSPTPQAAVAGETVRDAAVKKAHNARIRTLQEAVADGKDPETHASKVKEYIIVNVGPDYVKASKEKWESVLDVMDTARTAGTLSELVGA